MSSSELYYIAIIPPEPAYSRIHDLKLQIADKYGSRQALKSPPHITLISPFRAPGDQENEIFRIIADHRPDAPFKIRLKGFGRFNGKVLFINVDDNPLLNDLQSELEDAVREEKEIFNYNYDPRPYHPHITLGFKDWSREQFRRALEEFNGREFTAEFETGHLSLLKHNGKIWDVV